MRRLLDRRVPNRVFIPFLVAFAFAMVILTDAARSHYGWWTWVAAFDVALWGGLAVMAYQDERKKRS